MICKSSLIKVADNSGISYIRCLNIYKSYKFLIGSFMDVSLKYFSGKKKSFSSNTLKAIVIRTKQKVHRKTGIFLNFDVTEIILLDRKKDLIGTRIFGPIPLELRKKKKLKLLSISSYFI